MFLLAQNEYFNAFLKTTSLFKPLGVNHLDRYGEISKYSFLSLLISKDEILSDASKKVISLSNNHVLASLVLLQILINLAESYLLSSSKLCKEE